MKTSIAKTVGLMLVVLGLGATNVGCFLATHDPAALNRGVVTTTTNAELDGGTKRMRNANPVEINDVSRDVR